ncbi:LysR family transcriptional regulator [Xanthobacter aminoxidans]|uniref:LysR family transcriptional regulator n=1 Tax=Xanthobacter aminoxidans TaxID=186280 RepID=A0ABW6ZHF9_9HYPH
MRRRAHNGQEVVDQQNALLRGRIPLAALIQTLSVAEYLNFRHAANALGVSQSSVSTRIKTLEEDLGVVLFERRHRGVRLTDAGRSFITEVAAGISHLDLAIKTAGAVLNGAIGHLSIGLLSSIASGFLADLRRRYRDEHPEIELAIIEGRADEIIRQVREAKLDIAFVVGTAEVPDCHSRQLWSEALMAVLPHGHPLANAERFVWRDLAPETFLVRQDGAGPQVLDHIVRRLSEREKSPRIRRCNVGRDTLMHMVAGGDGITLTSEAASHVPFPGVVFRPIADEPDRARFSAVWSPHNRDPALRHLLDLATEMSKSARSG